MANDVAEVVNNTVSEVSADDTRPSSSIEKNALEWFLLSDPHVTMWMIFAPVIIVLGTFGNVMTIVVINRMSEGQSSHTMSLYFTALAVSDLVILYAGLLRDWFHYYFNIDVESLHISLCKLLPFLVYSSCMVSAWLIVSMTMQRVMSVVWPHYKNLSCTKTNVRLVISTVVAVPVTFNAHRIISYALVTKSNTEVCNSTSKEVDVFDFFIYPWIDLLLSSIIPFSILIFGNSVLVWKVIESVHVARVMTAGGCDQVNSRQKKASSLTLTLITVSMVFLLFSMPVSIYLIFEHYINIDTGITLAADKFIHAMCILAWYSNSAINFYLYCLTGSRFKNELKSLFCRQTQALKFLQSFRL